MDKLPIVLQRVVITTIMELLGSENYFTLVLKAFAVKARTKDSAYRVKAHGSCKMLLSHIWATLFFWILSGTRYPFRRSFINCIQTSGEIVITSDFAFQSPLTNEIH